MELLMIILAVLKWIGIILLGILALLTGILLLVLIWPITYHAEGSYQDKLLINARAGWFLGLLKIRLSYAEKLNISVRVSGIPIRSRSEKPSPDKQKTSHEPVSEPVEEEKPARDADKDAVTVKIPADHYKSNTETNKHTQTDTQRSEPDMDDRLSLLTEKLISFFCRIQDKYNNVDSKLRKLQKDLDFYVRLIKKEEAQRLIQRFFRVTGRILTHIRPRRLHVTAYIGMEDPSVTGQILAIQGLLYPWIAEKVFIFPDFEEEKIDVRFLISGHTVLGVLLICILNLVMNKDFLTVLRYLRKKEEKHNGRA